MKRLLEIPGKDESDASQPMSKLSNELAPRYNFLEGISSKVINRLIQTNPD